MKKEPFRKGKRQVTKLAGLNLLEEKSWEAIAAGGSQKRTARGGFEIGPYTRRRF